MQLRKNCFDSNGKQNICFWLSTQSDVPYCLLHDFAFSYCILLNDDDNHNNIIIIVITVSIASPSRQCNTGKPCAGPLSDSYEILCR